MASDDVREIVFIHFGDYHTKAVQLRGKYLRDYFPPVVRWPARLNRSIFASFVLAVIGITFAASFIPEPFTVPSYGLMPSKIAISSELSDLGIVDTF